MGPFLGISKAFSADILVTLLTTRTFHVTLSPFVGPRLSPLATSWLNKYGPYMQSLILEVDLTRLGLGPLHSERLRPGLRNLETLLHDFSMSQLRRDKALPLKSFVLLCRRFKTDNGDGESTGRYQSGINIKGYFPTSQAHRGDDSIIATDWEVVRAAKELSKFDNGSIGSGDSFQHASPTTTISSSVASSSSDERTQPHQRQDAFRIFNHLARLRSRIDALRICGFTEPVTHQILEILIPHFRSMPVQEHGYRIAPSTLGEE
ncbi:hypothetical protein RJ55_05137 [Drechmeria coniospora]|nr:hypothetical protein RJ55_05137 [Drechmeria coniospora]